MNDAIRRIPTRDEWVTWRDETTGKRALGRMLGADGNEPDSLALVDSAEFGRVRLPLRALDVFNGVIENFVPDDVKL